jgi:hypothetical protein
MVDKPLITSFTDGLPPHIAQVICGHRDISTTMGYKAIYPTEAIEAHRARRWIEAKPRQATAFSTITCLIRLRMPFAVRARCGATEKMRRSDNRGNLWSPGRRR